MGVESETGLDNFLRADTDRYKSVRRSQPRLPSIPRLDRKDRRRGGGATIKITNGGEKRGGGTVTNDNKSNDRFPGELASLSPIIRYKIESILVPRIRFGPRLLPTLRSCRQLPLEKFNVGRTYARISSGNSSVLPGHAGSTRDRSIDLSLLSLSLTLFLV